MLKAQILNRTLKTFSCHFRDLKTRNFGHWASFPRYLECLRSLETLFNGNLSVLVHFHTFLLLTVNRGS